MRRLSLVIILVVLAGCIPKPKPIDEERRNFDRSAIREYIFSSTPAVMFQDRAVFGGKIQLIGMDVEPRNVEPGDKITVSFYFKVLEYIDEDWQIFVHMDSWGGYSDRIHGDHFPVNGKYRTGFWQKGEIIKDSFTVRVPGDYNAPKIAVWMGFYTQEENRMKVDTSDKTVQHDGQNRVNAGLIPVNTKR